jgi:hypothetical protein
LGFGCGIAGALALAIAGIIEPLFVQSARLWFLGYYLYKKWAKKLFSRWLDF